MIYTVNNCIRAFGYTNFDNLIADMGSVDNLKVYVIANGYADIAVAEDTELLLVDVNGKTWHTGCYGAKLEPERDYLCFTLLEDYPESSIMFQPFEVHMSAMSQEVNANKKYWYKVNNGDWIEFNVTSWNGIDNPHDLKKGDKVYIKGDAQNMNTNEYCYVRVHRDKIYMPKKIQVSGDLSSLYDFNDTIPEYGFNSFFRTDNEYTTLTFKDLTFGSLTKLSPYCCHKMFSGNLTIKRAPELPATTLAAHCYDSMFYNCRTLNYVKAMFTDISAEGCLFGWLSDVSQVGTFIKNVEATYDNASANIPTDWTVINSDEPEPEPIPHDDYLCFTSHGQSTVKLTQQGNPYNGSDLKTIQYKLNDNGWQDWDLNEITLSDNDKMYLRGDAILLSENRYTYKQFVMTGSIAASGNIMSLIDYGKLHAYEFNMLFSGCTALTQAPTLPATQLTEGCYYYMFNGCTSLTAAPELPATTLQSSCYYGMFVGCKALTQAPTLPATTLALGCYYYMFNGCTSLTAAPELPATTLDSMCYSSMFKSCTSLTQAPDLNAPELSISCYDNMFNGCTNLNYVKALFNTIPSSTYTSNWLSGVSTTGTFVKNSKANWQVTGANGIPTGWTVQTVEGEDPKPDPHTDYLCLTAVNDGTTVQLYGKKIEGVTSTQLFYKSLNYKINDGSWSTMEMTHTDMTSDKVTLNAGDKMYLKGDVSGQSINEYMNIFIKGLVDCSGNINSINGFSKTATNNCFYKLFEGSDIRTAAITFDFDTVYIAAFASMFNNCTSLTTAPTILPTTNLDRSCYASMFSGCTALTNAPELPATAIARMCYSNMFKSCTSLVTAPALPATTLQSSCYSSMFNGCTSLTSAPELPATTLVTSCYSQMFFGCTKLNYIKAMFTTTPGTYTKNWLANVAITGTFVKNASATWDVTGTNGIPTGWTVQTASPDK